jgi:hypothetical protein
VGDGLRAQQYTMGGSATTWLRMPEVMQPKVKTTSQHHSNLCHHHGQTALTCNSHELCETAL